MSLELLKGNTAIAEASVRAGLEAYFGYPITPQTELLEWLSSRMPELGRVFLQAESEVAAVNMLYGAACTGARVMTSSSSPGISLMMEGISYIAGTELPAVIVDVVRGGPGLGNIAPSQGDYNQIVHGGGHGDYFPIVLAPSSVQEAIDLTVLAFDLAENYLSIVFIMADGNIGQMMEPAELPEMRPLKKRYPEWAVRGSLGSDRHMFSSINLEPEKGESTNLRLIERWERIKNNEIRYREYYLDDAEIIVVGFGSAGRIAFSAVRTARKNGIPVGLLRPITLNPFPIQTVYDLAKNARAFLVVEMNTGQMLDDVQIAANGQTPVEFYGRLGGMVPYPEEIINEIERLAHEPIIHDIDPRTSWIERLKININ